MYKVAVLAVVATVALAMPHDFKSLPTTGDFPLPVVPFNFEATSYQYIYPNSGTRIVPADKFSSQRYSSSLNKIHEVQGTIDGEGEEVITSVETTDATTRTAVEWEEAHGCTTAQNVKVNPVNQTIATYFDGFSYAGVQYAPWELTRVKYHRLDSQGVQYFYKQSNLQLRFFVEIGAEESIVHDFASGLVERNDFTNADFAVSQCSAEVAFLQ